MLKLFKMFESEEKKEATTRSTVAPSPAPAKPKTLPPRSIIGFQLTDSEEKIVQSLSDSYTSISTIDELNAQLKENSRVLVLFDQTIQAMSPMEFIKSIREIDPSITLQIAMIIHQKDGAEPAKLIDLLRSRLNRFIVSPLTEEKLKPALG